LEHLVAETSEELDDGTAFRHSKDQPP
jgi:hypothetical protein